jgi:uncharacterized protein involved in exopolysaccharide biosynthesis
LISVEVQDGDPQFAAELANGYVEALRELLTTIAVSEAQQRRVFFENQLAVTKDNLIKAEIALKSTGINSGTLKLSSGVAVESLARLKATMAAQEIKLASMRGYLTESAPEFKQAKIEMLALRSQLNRIEKEEPNADPAGSEYISKYRDYKYYETLLEIFTKQYEVARLDEMRESPIIQVLEVAEPASKRPSVNRIRIALTTSIGFGVALLIFIFTTHAFKNAANNPETNVKIKSVKIAVARAFGRD